MGFLLTWQCSISGIVLTRIDISFDIKSNSQVTIVCEYYLWQKSKESVKLMSNTTPLCKVGLEEAIIEPELTAKGWKQ